MPVMQIEATQKKRGEQEVRQEQVQGLQAKEAPRLQPAVVLQGETRRPQQKCSQGSSGIQLDHKGKRKRDEQGVQPEQEQGLQGKIPRANKGKSRGHSLSAATEAAGS